jgi:hypothetical protein
MPFSVFATILSSQLIVTVADRAPNLDVKPSCRESTVPDCLSQEQFARDQLIKDWPNFTAQEKTRCAAEAKYAGAPSYVEWLTCLQINANARKVPATGAGTGGGPSSGTHRSRRHTKLRRVSQLRI